nr:hypothetical protein [Thalassotalea sp. PS06]
MTKPTLGQMEQVSNALALRQLGKATVMNHLDKQMIGDWLLNVFASEELEAQPLPDVALAVVEWILGVDRQSIKALSQSLWKSNCRNNNALTVHKSTKVVI